MNLLEDTCLFLDGQTTGMRPPHGQLLELGFSLGSAADLPPVVASQIFSLGPERSLQKKISEITGLQMNDLEGRPEPKSWFAEVFLPWIEEHKPKLAVVHYAQFELPFLKEHMEIGFEVLCTQQLTKRLFPTLPSQNIRAVAGYFGHPVSGPNRAGEFALATASIWSGLTQHLKECGVHTLGELQQWIKDNPQTKPKKKSISYRIGAEQRLTLPDLPGIYKMLAKDGRVLYVGKATSLKDRVNSYFRGTKNRDRRKLEMLAQVWDLKTEVCGSPLEAALCETDEIKRFDPPYNVTFKKNQRQLVFYSECYSSSHPEQSSEFRRGPFRPGNWIDMVIQLHRSLHQAEFEQVFFDPIDPVILKDGFELFLQKHSRSKYSFPSVRSLLAYGAHLFRNYEEPEEIAEPETSEDDAELVVDADYVAGKFERLLRRAGGELDHARRLRRMLNAEAEFTWNGQTRTVRIRNGKVLSPGQEINLQNSLTAMAWDIEVYDRLNVLLSELNRHQHRILRHSPRAAK
jgi:DNA polymerase-3 subunit epsilon